MTRDDRLRCQCRSQPDSYGCDLPATAEDMLCDTCRTGCVSWCLLGAEDTALHLDATGDLTAMEIIDAADGVR